LHQRLVNPHVEGLLTAVGIVPVVRLTANDVNPEEVTK